MSLQPEYKLPIGPIVSANCSFVTSFPGLFTFPASENLALYTILKQQQKEPTVEYLLDLFQLSITKILSGLDAGDDKYSAAGLQELNNTEKVFTLINNMQSEFSFLCSNVSDGKTYPALGYLLPKSYLSKLFDKTHNDGRVLCFNDLDKGNHFINIDDTQDDTQIDKNKCHTLTMEKISNKMSIRDLGTVENIEGVYLMKTEKIPDLGRPISMIIIDHDNTIIIHLNCHMVNPSVLKCFVDDNGSKKNIQQDKTVLQLGEDEVHNGISAINLWVNYCVKRLETTITEMLSDFDITGYDNTQNEETTAESSETPALSDGMDNAVVKTVTEDDNNPTLNTKPITWILTGDFNDAHGKLKEHLTTTGIKVLGKTITFNFGEEQLKTCCPNTNSCNPTLDESVKQTLNDKYNMNAEKPEHRTAANLSFNAISDAKDQAKTLIENFDKFLDPNVFAFQGDYVGISTNAGLTPQVDTLQKKTGDLTSDHLFVKATFIPAQSSAGAGIRRRRARRSIKRNRRTKKNARKVSAPKSSHKRRRNPRKTKK